MMMQGKNKSYQDRRPNFDLVLKNIIQIFEERKRKYPPTYWSMNMPEVYNAYWRSHPHESCPDLERRRRELIEDGILREVESKGEGPTRYELV